nr:translational initiation factor 1 [Atalantia ceylanica]UTS57242.1 translational initiation factor 1 [Atalantia ceylanica]
MIQLEDIIIYRLHKRI